MRVKRALAHQAKTIVDIEVAAAPRIELRDPFHLVGILGDMGLQIEAVMLVEQTPGELELALGGRRRETRRYRVEQPVAPVPALDQRLAVLV